MPIKKTTGAEAERTMTAIIGLHEDPDRILSMRASEKTKFDLFLTWASVNGLISDAELRALILFWVRLNGGVDASPAGREFLVRVVYLVNRHKAAGWI